MELSRAGGSTKIYGGGRQHILKYSQPLRNTLLKHLWQQLQPQVFLIRMQQAWHTYFWSVSPIFFAGRIKLHQVGWGVSVHSHFQISPEVFNQVQVWALAGPLKDIYRVVPKPLLLSWLCAQGRWNMNLCPSLRFRVLQSRFSSRMSLYIATFIFPSILTSLTVPVAEKHPHSMMLPPPCFTVGMVLAR